MTKGNDSLPPSNQPRSRGIRASQKKLRTALLAAGFKSQTEVSEKIQHMEALKKPPRSLVRRVFHGDAVDPLSIERVAKALNTEAWTLYLDSAEKINPNPIDETQSDESESTLSIGAHLEEAPAPTDLNIANTESASPSQPHNQRKALFIIVLLVVLGALVIDRFWSFNDSPDTSPARAGIVDFSNKVVAVIPINGTRGVDITHKVEQFLAEKTRLIVGSSALYANISNPQELLSSRKADMVISGELVEIGRYLAVRLFLSQDQNMRHIWSGIFAKSTSEKYIRDQLEEGLNTLLSNQSLTDRADWQNLQRFLRGMQHFENERTEQAILRAMAEFQGVIGGAPNLVHGHAGMCIALVEQNIRTSNKNYLDEADRHCAKGFKIKPNSLFIQFALGNLARVRGEIAIAQKHFEQALHIDPNYVSAIQKYSENQLRAFLKSREPALFEDIENRLTFAHRIEPDNWKTPYTLGRAYYFTGNQAAAIEQFTQAANLSVNFATLNNLASLQFCAGDLENAKSHYQQALILRPKHSVLLSNIAILHFYLGENDQALAIFEPQIKQIQQIGGPSLYQLWSNVADVYRIQGKNDQALIAYRNAMSEIDREVSQGEANVMQRATRLALYVLVTMLSPNMQTEQLLASLKQQALALKDVADPISLHQLALSWLYLGDQQKAKGYRDKLHGICPGYAASPDFKPLQNNTL